MTKLEELIEKLCPDGVEYVKLGDVCDIKGRIGFRGYTRQDQVEQGNGAISLSPSNIVDGNIVYDNCTYITWEKYEESPEIKANTGDIIFCKTASVGKTALIKELPEKATINPQLVLINNIKCNNSFLSYVLKGKDFQNKVSKIKGLGTIPTISQKDFYNLTIPLPPLPVQEEIVRILDKFTTLTAELQAELQARRQQYKYYHNKLMNFSENDVEFRSVGELFEFKNGLNKEKNAFGKGQPIINFTDVYNKRWLANGLFNGLVDVSKEEIERYSARKGDVFFTRTSETKEDIGMSSTLIEDVPNCVFSGFVLRARPTTNLLLPKFCSYYFATDKVRNTIVRYAAFTTRATTTGSKLSKIAIPILPIEEQERIVSILDRFDKLCNDITTGLPAEIEARQKQYEYYRDKLLTFKRKE